LRVRKNQKPSQECLAAPSFLRDRSDPMKRFSPEQIRFVLMVCAVVLALSVWRYFNTP
jgi:hypothetical protein